MFPTEGPQAPSLVFGVRDRTPDQQLMFMMDCAIVTGGRGFSLNWGDRFMDLETANTSPQKPKRKDLSIVKAQQAMGMESAAFRKRRRRGEMDDIEIQEMFMIAPGLMTAAEQARYKEITDDQTE